MAIFNGTDAPETLTGATGEDNLINGGGGNDRLEGGGPLIGDPPSNDTINGGEGDDSLYGLTGSDMLFGGPGDDELQGGPGAGGFEDDTLDGGTGADVMIGQAGNDVYFVDNPGDSVAEFSSDPADEVRSTIAVSLSALEAAGGDANVIEILTLLGSADIDGTGNDLDNTINGNSGANALAGGIGDDTLAGGAGDDTIDGGDDTDTAVIGVARAEAEVSFDGGAVIVVSSLGTDRFENIELFAFTDQTIAAGDLTEDMNTAPTAVDDSAGTAFETPVLIDVLGNDTDADGDTLTIDGIAFPASNGSVSFDAMAIRYTPNAGFSGTDTFTYGIVDGNGGTDTATVTVTVDPMINTAPTAANDSASTAFETAVRIAVLGNDSDADGDTPSIASVTDPANGTAAIEGGQIRYTPGAGFSGVDMFSYTVSDGRGGTDTASVTVTVGATMPMPPPGRDSFVTAVSGPSVNGPVTFDLGEFYTFDFGDFSVGSGYSLTVEQPENATVTVVGDTLTVVADAVYNGIFGLRYSFGADTEPTESGRLAVLGWDTSQPVASPLEARFGFDTASPAGMGGDFLSFGGLIFDGDEEQARLDREGVEPPDFSINGMTVAELANGDLIEILLAAVNEDGFLTFDLEIGGEMVFAIDLDQDVDMIDAVPDDTSSFLYRVRDPEGNSSIGVFSIEVGTDATPNAAPVAATDRARTAPGTQILLDVLANDADTDGGVLSINPNLPTEPQNGTATVEGGRIAYLPDAGFTGSDSFVYVITDGQGGLAVGSVEIEVGADPDMPLAAADSISTGQFVPVTIDVLANDSDPDDDPLTVTEVGRPGRGGVQINGDGTVSYAPRRGFTGEDSFDYTISDGRGGTATASVTVSVADLPEDTVTARVVAYLYEAAFGRFPDLGGVNFWIGTVLDNPAFTPTNAASAFLQAREFEDLFGGVETLTDTQLIEQLYLNVLDRPGEDGGIVFWEGQLALPGVTREDMLLSFAESAENQFGSPRIATLEEISPGQWDFA